MIYVRADGSVAPSTAPISTVDNVTYTLTDNIVVEVPLSSSAIVVERDNIGIDGAGYTLQGIEAVGSVGIYLSDRSNVTIKNMEIKTFYFGILIFGSSNSVISGNNITNNKECGISLDYFCDHNSISGNNITTNKVGIRLSESSNYNTISGNNITENNGYGIYFGESSSNTISGNNITNNNYTGIWLSESSNNNIDRNNITENSPAGIYLAGSSNNSISGNNITNSYTGIWLSESSNYNTISGNNITANNQDGIDLSKSSNYNTISGNDITNNGYGIDFWESSNNNIDRNNITANGWDGFSLSSSNYNTISGNNITNNYYGISLSESSSNTISGNNITANNGYGIYLLKSSNNNKFYDNNFINNTKQVYDYSWGNPEVAPSVNMWDYGYPSGGNYWSDYTGVDVKGGPNQDQPSSDGRGDIAYVIYANTTDRYPLMYPWGAPPPPSYTLTIYSSPNGAAFTVDGVSRITPWSGTYSVGALVSLEMLENHTVGDAKYYWTQWSDGNTSRPRTVTMTTNIKLTANFTGPHYQLTVTSSPTTGIQFTINEVPQTTQYEEWMLEGSYTLEMPETHNGRVWSHWLEDGDTNRMKTITLAAGTTWTAVYIPAPPPFWMQWWFWLIIAVAIIILAVILLLRMRRKKPYKPPLKRVTFESLKINETEKGTRTLRINQSFF